jgi:hypothetical protein
MSTKAGNNCCKCAGLKSGVFKDQKAFIGKNNKKDIGQTFWREKHCKLWVNTYSKRVCPS